MLLPDTSEVFLIMGQCGEHAEIAIVIAQDARSAVQHFQGSCPGMHAVSWPSLADTAEAARLMQRAQRGETPVVIGDEDVQVLHAPGFIPRRSRVGLSEVVR